MSDSNSLVSLGVGLALFGLGAFAFVKQELTIRKDRFRSSFSITLRGTAALWCGVWLMICGLIIWAGLLDPTGYSNSLLFILGLCGAVSGSLVIAIIDIAIRYRNTLREVREKRESHGDNR